MIDLRRKVLVTRDEQGWVIVEYYFAGKLLDTKRYKADAVPADLLKLILFHVTP